MFLVDTSVWIEVFRKPARFELESVVELDEVVTCLPIIQEVLQGFKDERAFQIARSAIFALPLVESPLRREVFERSVSLYRSARKAGLTPRSSIDCLIASCAMMNDLTVLHYDRDFDLLAKVAPLKSQRLR